MRNWLLRLWRLTSVRVGRPNEDPGKASGYNSVQPQRPGNQEGSQWYKRLCKGRNEQSQLKKGSRTKRGGSVLPTSTFFVFRTSMAWIMCIHSREGNQLC